MVKKRCIENRTFAESAIGEEASLARTLTPRDIELFAAMSGDINPAHVDGAFAKSDMFSQDHRPWHVGGALISAVLGTELPGPDTIYVRQTLNFRRPIGLGDTVIVVVRATAKGQAKCRITFDRLQCRQPKWPGADKRPCGGQRADGEDLPRALAPAADGVPRARSGRQCRSATARNA